MLIASDRILLSAIWIEQTQTLLNGYSCLSGLTIGNYPLTCRPLRVVTIAR
jgi:hypothetical protein